MYDPKNPAGGGNFVSLSSLMAVLFFFTTAGAIGFSYYLDKTRPPKPSFGENTVVMVESDGARVPAKILFRRMDDDGRGKFYWSYTVLSPEKLGYTSFGEEDMSKANEEEMLRYASSEAIYQKRMEDQFTAEVERVQQERPAPAPLPVVEAPAKEPEPAGPPEVETDGEVE